MAGRAPGLRESATFDRDVTHVIQHAAREGIYSSRLDPELAGRRVANYLRTMTLEAQTLARACGESHVLISTLILSAAI